MSNFDAEPKNLCTNLYGIIAKMLLKSSQYLDTNRRNKRTCIVSIICSRTVVILDFEMEKRIFSMLLIITQQKEDNIPILSVDGWKYNQV